MSGYVGRNFPNVPSGNRRRMTFNYSRDLSEGEVVLSAVWTCAVASFSAAADASAASRLDVAAAGIESPRTRQWFTPGVEGCTYRIEATAATNLGQTITLWSYCLCPVRT